jgi:hypothetical protein
VIVHALASEQDLKLNTALDNTHHALKDAGAPVCECPDCSFILSMKPKSCPCPRPRDDAHRLILIGHGDRIKTLSCAIKQLQPAFHQERSLSHSSPMLLKIDQTLHHLVNRPSIRARISCAMPDRDHELLYVTSVTSHDHESAHHDSNDARLI